MAVSKNTHRPTPRANPKKKTRSKLDELDMEPDVPIRPALYPPRPRPGIINFTEAAGKTVAYIYIDYIDAPDWQSLEVYFTDGTSFLFRLMPRVHVRVDYEESRRDDLETIRKYGVIECNPPENGDG